MFDFLGINRKRKLDDLLNVENILQSSLKPVSPRPEFIQNLHKGLMEYSFPEQDSSEVDIKKAVLIATLGFAAWFIMISVWVRNRGDHQRIGHPPDSTTKKGTKAV
jgi:hypothetical protein